MHVCIKIFVVERGLVRFIAVFDPTVIYNKEACAACSKLEEKMKRRCLSTYHNTTFGHTNTAKIMFGTGDFVVSQQPSQRLPSSFSNIEIKIPLRQFMQNDSNSIQPHLLSTRLKHQLILRKLTVAYSLAKLIHHTQHHRQRSGISEGGTSSAAAFDETLFQLDNFIVRIVPAPTTTQQPHSPQQQGGSGGGGGDASPIFTTAIVGVDTLSPPLFLNIIAPDFSDSFLNTCEQNTNGQKGCYHSLEVEIVDPTSLRLGWGDEYEVSSSSSSSNNTTTGRNKGEHELLSCHLFGVLLHELIAGVHPFPEEEAEEGQLGLSDDEERFRESTTSIGSSSVGEPLPKKTMEDLFLSVANDDEGDNNNVDSSIKNKAFARALCITRKEEETTADNGGSNENMSKYIPLKELGFPSPLSLLVVNLLECGWGEFRPDDSMPSLQVAINDLSLLLGDPDRFLFDSLEKQMGRLNVRQDKLYGREKEAALITHAFYRVSLSGESEALLVDGFSGCGKSKLIQSVVGHVDIAGGYVIRGKFDEIAQNSSQIGVLTNALNQLCVLICEKNEPTVVNEIVIELMLVFGTQMYTLARVLPNITMLSNQLDLSDDQNTALNHSSISYVLLLFLRVVSSKSRPVLFYLDNLHWADPATLDVIHCILSDIKGNNCVFVVGSYRNNEIESHSHPLRMFIDKLEECQVHLTKVHLDGLEAAELNTLVSDALGLFPRLSRSLSDIIQRKTKGNPFYVLEFLKSLVEQNLLQYGLRERRWVWDVEKIESEQISESVSELLAQKISSLPKERQTALKIASCFGTSISSDVVSSMSAVADYSFFGRELECAYSEGFMERDVPSGGYKFAHDKVAEAAYGQMKEEDRNRLHYEIGVVLRNSCGGLASDNKVFLCVDQLNRGQEMINGSEEVLQVVQTNHSAASMALKACNFTAALRYAKTALKLIEQDNEFASSKSILSVMASAAYACGHFEEASSAIDTILRDEASLDEKFMFDVYDLKITMLVSRQEGKLAFSTCLEVLRKLGEEISTTSASDAHVMELQKRLRQITDKYGEITESDLLKMKEMTSPNHLRLMHFYNHLVFISYFLKNMKMVKDCSCRLLELTLEHGVSKHSTTSLARYAMTLPTKEGYRIGKMAISLLQRFDATDQIPSVYLCFYGYIAIYIEPLQSCAEMLKRGFEIGLSIRDAATFHDGNQYIQKSLLSGMNLQLLKKESQYQLRLGKEHSQTTAMLYCTQLNDTISTLINKNALVGSGSERENISTTPEYEDSVTFHNAMKSFWLGYYDRCCYHCERGIAVSDIKQIKSVMLMFYNGISCFHSSKKVKSNRKLKNAVRNAIKVMEEMKEESPWNYANKLHLLEAESYSSNGHSSLAIKSYNAAIEASRLSRFVHEQGLSCELAALHFKRMKDLNTSLTYFKEAKACYEQWGAQVKVDAIAQQIDSIQSAIEKI